MTDTETAHILVATADYRDGEVYMTLTNHDKTEVNFILDPMAVATLALTLQPAMRVALADHRAKNPDFGKAPEVPDFYEEEGP